MNTDKGNKFLASLLPENIIALRIILALCAVFWIWVLYTGVSENRVDRSCYYQQATLCY